MGSDTVIEDIMQSGEALGSRFRAPASTRDEQGGGYQRGDVQSRRGAEPGRSSGSTDDPADTITAGEGRTGGRPLGGWGSLLSITREVPCPSKSMFLISR